MTTALAGVSPDETYVGVPSGTWQIDAAHSAIGFTVRHLMSKVRGRFTEFNGHITVDDDLLASAVEVTVDLASVDTGNAMRDGHLRSSDFFAVDETPTMSFASTRLRPTAEGSWALDGELTIRGTTRAVQIDLEFLGFDPTGMQGEPRIGFEGRTSINRSAFGVSFGLVDGGKVVVSDKVDILLEIEATLPD